MVDTDGAANGSVEAEDKEVFLVPAANTVTQEEAVVVQDVDTPPAVGTMMGPVGHMQVTAEALLVPLSRVLLTLGHRVMWTYPG